MDISILKIGKINLDPAKLTKSQIRETLSSRIQAATVDYCTIKKQESNLSLDNWAQKTFKELDKFAEKLFGKNN